MKAYDLGLIDARGRTETRVIAEMLAAAESMVGGRLEREASLMALLCKCTGQSGVRLSSRQSIDHCLPEDTVCTWEAVACHQPWALKIQFTSDAFAAKADISLTDKPANPQA